MLAMFCFTVRTRNTQEQMVYRRADSTMMRATLEIRELLGPRTNMPTATFDRSMMKSLQMMAPRDPVY